MVEVDKLGYAITIPTALTASNTPATIEHMKRYEIAAFIRNARSVSSDPAVEQNMLNDLLAHAHGTANKFLESYFHADDFAKNPFQLMKHQTVSVQIESILQASPKSYEVRWSETALDMSGAPLGTSHWEAILETEISPQNSTDTIISNPLGFYADTADRRRPACTTTARGPSSHQAARSGGSWQNFKSGQANLYL